MIKTTALHVHHVNPFNTFLWRPLHDYEKKPPNLTFYGGRGHATTNFPSSFWTWIKSLRIQLQENSPTFDILSGSKKTRVSLKELKIIFLTMFSPPPSSPSLLKVPITRLSTKHFLLITRNKQKNVVLNHLNCELGTLLVWNSFSCRCLKIIVTSKTITSQKQQQKTNLVPWFRLVFLVLETANRTMRRQK